MAALTKTLLVQLAEIRLAEAEHLLGAGYFSGAFYLGGYAVELGLKACIAATFQPESIPDRRLVDRIYTHDLLKLVELAGWTRVWQGRAKRTRYLRATGKLQGPESGLTR